MGEYLVAVSEDRISLLQKHNNTFVFEGEFPQMFSIERVINGELLRLIKRDSELFINGMPNKYYKVSPLLGEVIHYLSKLFSMSRGLEATLMLMEETQLLTLLREERIEELRDRLVTRFMTREIEGKEG